MSNTVETQSQPEGQEVNGNSHDLFRVWKEYEKVAMHFNDLLLKIRSQSLAAVGAFATVAGVLLKSNVLDARVRWGALIAVFFALSVFWLAIWVLDFGYYNRLLIGAVRALTVIERKSEQSTRVSTISLSTSIERAVRGKGSNRPGVEPGPCYFYLLIWGLLNAGVTISTYEYCRADASLVTAPFVYWLVGWMIWVLISVIISLKRSSNRVSAPAEAQGLPSTS